MDYAGEPRTGKSSGHVRDVVGWVGMQWFAEVGWVVWRLPTWKWMTLLSVVFCSLRLAGRVRLRERAPPQWPGGDEFPRRAGRLAGALFARMALASGSFKAAEQSGKVVEHEGAIGAAGFDGLEEAQGRERGLAFHQPRRIG